MVGIRTLERACRDFNRQYFGDHLSKRPMFYFSDRCPFIPKKHGRVFDRTRYGETSWWETRSKDGGSGGLYPAIVFNSLSRQSLALAMQTLLHEMVHVENPRLGHGKKFKARQRELMARGAYDRWL